MSNGGGLGGRAQELRSSDLWGRQLISERRTFIFLEAENSPVETNSTVPVWMLVCLCNHTGLGVTHLGGVCTWTAGVGVCAWACLAHRPLRAVTSVDGCGQVCS